MSRRPSIAVVVPAYNAERWIAETLRAVLAQTSPADEVVVVDDGSTDATRAVLEEFADDVRVIAQPNAGCGAAFNTAIEAAQTEYVALCPADDLWVPEKLEWQRETLRAHPQVDVSFGAAVNFGALEGPFPRPSLTGLAEPRALLREMFTGNVVPDPSVVVRRALLQRLGGFVHEVGEDYELWMRALRQGAVFHFDPRVLVRLRQHDANLSSDAVAIREMNVAVRRAAAADLGDPALARRVIARDLRSLGRAYLGAGGAEQARSAYRDSLRTRISAPAVAASALLGLPGAGRAVARLRAARAAG